MRSPETAPSMPLRITCGKPRLSLEHPTIRREVERILALRRSSLRTNVDIALQIGASLSRMKARLKYGLWYGLLRNQLHYGSATAKRYICLYRFAESHGSLVSHLKQLGPSKLTSLAALTPEIRRKALSPPSHQIPGSRRKTLEEMNATEFASLLRGLDPRRRTHAPRARRLFRNAIHTARQLIRGLGALKHRTLNDSDLLKDFLEAILELKRLLARYPGEPALRRLYARPVTG